MIKKIDFPSSPMPSKDEDWEKLMNVLTVLASRNPDASVFKSGKDLSALPVLSEGSIFIHGGSIIILEQDVTLPMLAVDDDYILVLKDNLTFDLVDNINDYRLSTTYGGLYSGKNQALPFVVRKVGNNYHKGKIMNLQYRLKDALLYYFDTGQFGGNILFETVRGKLIINGDLTVYGSIYVDGFFTANSITAESIFTEVVLAP